MDETTCPVCKIDLRTGMHELDAHRRAIGLDRETEDYRKLNPETNRLVEEAITRHPSGRKLPGGSHRG